MNKRISGGYSRDKKEENTTSINKRKVEDTMLEWKCKIENPIRKGPVKATPTIQVPSCSIDPNSSSSFSAINALNSSEQILNKLPKIVAFEKLNIGGGGAPRRTPSGTLITELRGHPEIRFHQRDNSIFERSIRYQIDKDQIKKYKEELDKQIAFKLKAQNNENYNGSLTPTSKMNTSSSVSIDLATIMSSNNELKRWESLPKLTSTDITRCFVNSPRISDSDEFKRALEIQLENKRKFQQEQKRNERLLNSLHFSAFDNFWGKPIGPRRKENLFKLLHNPSQKKFPDPKT